MNDDSMNRLFEIKKKFLSTVPHPKVISKYIDRLDAAPHSELNESLNKNESLESFLDKYIKLLLDIKLRISNARTSDQLGSALIDLREIHLKLIEKLATYSDDLPDKDVPNFKQSSAIDGYELLKFVRESDLEEAGVKQRIGKGDFDDVEEKNDSLTNAILRARRIISDGR